jgi:hypothetical protein
VAPAAHLGRTVGGGQDVDGPGDTRVDALQFGHAILIQGAVFSEVIELFRGPRPLVGVVDEFGLVLDDPDGVVPVAERYRPGLVVGTAERVLAAAPTGPSLLVRSPSGCGVAVVGGSRA